MNNIFNQIYDTAVMHATEIFSLLSLIGTMIVSYFYKRGLLPSVKNALSTLGGIVGNIKETSERQHADQLSSAQKLDERLDEFEKALEGYEKTLENMEARLVAEREVYLQLEKTKLILSSQVDMLYDIFMTSALPQYQKETTGERINKMRRELERHESV